MWKLLAIWILVLAFAPPATGQSVPDPELSVETVVTGLASPTTLAFLGPDDILVLEPGEWSTLVPVNFPMTKMWMMEMGGIVRFYLKALEPDFDEDGTKFELDAAPVFVDPMAPSNSGSEPDDAAVGDVLGTLAVVVAEILMLSMSIWKVSATTWATLVCRPWPISVPPWFRYTLPSV